jgi:L-ascorbate metabolism protein UlaG (beta-lactamase superfamily)
MKEKDINFKKSNNKHRNWVTTRTVAKGRALPLIWNLIKSNGHTVPKGNIPVNHLKRSSFDAPPAQGLVYRWLGHSSVMVEMEGCRILFDPVISDNTSLLPGKGKRFSDPPISLDNLPDIDLVMLSHDHFDHLDMAVMKAVKHRETSFVAAKGIGKYLADWGISSDRIQEMSWWEKTGFGELEIIFVPARHFSGRGMLDANKTLWGGWVIRDNDKSVYFSGDTGYADHFKVIGHKYGPFDLTMINVGSYSDFCPDIQFTPELSIRAHLEANGRVLLPLHWATYDLTFHPWDEPIIRAMKAAKENNVKISTPLIGARVDLDKPIESDAWWEEV